MKLDLGCGKAKIAADWTGVDAIAFPGVDIVCDLTAREGLLFKPWPWADASVDEAHCSHFIEHLDAAERIHFANELYRVLKPGASARIITPSWSSERAYGDLTHKWPPVSGFWYFYLKAEWRAANAPHNTGYTCNFEAAWGFGMRQDLISRNQEYQQYALTNYINAATDMIATLTKLPAPSAL